MTTLNLNRPERSLTATSVGWPAGPAVEGGSHQAYSESAFRYFLSLERKRAERSGRSLLLLLVDFGSDTVAGAAIPAALSAKVLSGLSLCVRDVDFIGWYRDHKVAGAVLTQRAESPGPDIANEIVRRVNDVFRDTVPPHLASRIHVRVLHVQQSA